MANRINFQIGYSIDKAGLQEMQSLFQQIANRAKEPGAQLNSELQKAASTANTLDGILEKTFNTNLGTLNVTKFNQELSKSGLTLKDVQSNLSSMGNQGVTAYNRLAQAILGTNLQLKESNKLLDSMATTMANTVKWGITSSIFNNITNSIQKAYTYSKQLDTSLNDIRIVTDKSADSMERFAEQANQASKQMGASTLDYTNAALIYYQQGLSDEEVAARAETTIKAANVTGQTGEAVSEQLTAVWNGYKATAQETELYVDKLAAVAATTAADLEELSIGMSKVASAANAMGVDFDDLNAQIATIVSVTRQAPESVGTALKTIYARLGDLKVDGVDEFGVKLGEVSEQMQTMGIQILDQNGDLRNMSSVIAEVASKWDTWTNAQRQAAAVAMAGKRQYNNLIALFDNWDMYTDALNTSVDAMGTLQHQQDIYMESTSAKLKTLKATWQDLYDGIIDQDELNTGIDALTNLVQVFDNFIDSFGGGVKSITAFGTTIASVFNKQIINGINTAIQRQEVFKQNLNLAKTNAETRQNGTEQLDFNATDQQLATKANTEIQLEYAQKIYDARIGLNQEQYNTLINYQKEIGNLEEESVLYQKQIDFIKERNKFSDEENVYLEKNKYNSLEILTTYYERVEAAKEEAQISKDMFNAYKETGIQQQELVNIKTQLLNRSQNLNESEKEALQNLIKRIDANESIETLESDILETLNQIYDANRKNLQIEKQKEKAVQDLANVYEKQNKAQEKQNNTKQEADAMLELGNNATIVAQKVTTITSALGSMAMAWSSVNSLIQTWNDESTSFGDKITQTFMTVSMTLPMVISNFSKLKETFGFTAESFHVLKLRKDADTASTIANTAAQKASIAMTQLVGTAKEEEVAFILSKISAEELEAITQGKSTAAEVANNIALKYGNELKKEGIILSADEIAAIEATILAKKGEATARKAASEAAKAELLVATIGITAVIAVISAGISAYNNYNQTILENAKTSLENAKAKQEENKANEELYQSYKKTLESYKNGTSSKEELKAATEKVCEAYDIEINKLDFLTGKYDKVTKAIKAKRDANLQESKTLLETELANQGIAAFQNAREGRGYKLNNQYRVEFHSFNPFFDIDKDLEEILDENVSDNFKINGAKGVFSLDYGNMEQLLQLYDELEIAQSKYIKKVGEEKASASADYAVLHEWIERLKLDLESYRDIQNQLKDTNAEREINKIDFSGIDNLIDYKNKLEEIVDILIKQGFSEEEAAQYAKIHASNLNELNASLQEQLDLSKEISDTTGINEEELNKYIENLSDFEKQIIFSGQIDFDTIKTIEDINKEINRLQNKVDQEDLSVVVSLRSKVASDKKLTKAQLKEMAGEQSSLEQDYEIELSDFDNQSQLKKVDTLNEIANEKIQNNNEYIKSINKTIDADRKKLEEDKKFYEEEIALLEYRKKAAFIDKDPSLFTKEDSERLDELTEKIIVAEDKLAEFQDYLTFDEFNDTSFNNIISGIDGIITEASVLKDLAELVGEEWLIAAKDIEEFGKNFPDILEAQENYNFLQDGSVQLTEKGQQALRELVNLRKADLETNNKAYQIELQKQIDLQQAKAEYYTEQANLLRSYLSNQANAKNTERKMEKNLADYKKQIMEITGQNDKELNQTIQQNLGLTNINAQSNIQDIYDYWCSVGEAAALAGQAYEAKQFNPPNFKEGKHTASVQSVKFKARGAEDTTLGQLDESELRSLVETYEKAAEEAANKASTLISKKASLGSIVNSANQAMEGAASGVGGKEKKEKKEKEKKDKELKQLDDEFDRYWKIKKAIDSLDRSIKRLDKDQENLHGYELINSLRQENKLLEQQQANYKALYLEQQKEADELRKQLGTMGVMFDASGAILNYANATSKALAEYNEAVKKYNAGLIDDTTFNVYEKSFEEFKKLLDRYDQLYYTEIEDTKDKIDDIYREELANNLKGWEVEIEVKLNLKELEREWNDFLNEINKDFKKVYQNLRVEVGRLQENARTYIGSEGSIGTIINAIHDVTAEIDKMRAGGFSNMFESISQAQEKLKELNTQLQSEATSLRDAWKEAWQSYLDGIDQVADKFDDLMDQFERIDNELAFQGQLIEILYGEKAYQLMDTLYKGQEKSLMNQIKSVKDQTDMWKELWERSGATLENQSDWTEDQKKYYDQWTKAQNDLNDLVIDYIQLLKKDYLNTVDQILNDLEKSLTGSSLKDMRTEWERISAYSDKYLDDVEQAYEAQKLANKIDQSIANASSLKNQQKLQALRDKEIKYLREKENLTQYDLDAAEARYQIALKEMALEDARNNKTSMKLVRNEQGDWSYQYLADEENVMMKQQELLDAYNDLYQLASDAYEANLEALQDLQEKYLESAKEIYLDETLSEEEKQQKLQELREWYFEQYSLLAEENTLYRDGLASSSAILLKEIYDEDKEAYESMTDEEKAMVDALTKSNIEDYADLEKKIKSNYNGLGEASDALMDSTRRDWSSTAQQLADVWNKDDGNSVKSNILDAHTKIGEATAEYQDKVAECADEVGRNFGPEGITGAIEEASDATEDLKYKTEELVYDSTSYLDDLRMAVEDIENAWNSVKDAIENAIYTLQEYIRMMNQIPEPQAAVTPVSLPEYTSTPESQPTYTPEPTNETPHRTAPLVLNPVIGVNPDNDPNRNKNYYVGYEGGGSTKRQVVNNLTLEEAQEEVERRNATLGGGGGGGKFFVGHYDTGGYTGTWNSGDTSGKLAFLHQKELVLNKDDTKNFLDGINTLRDLSSLNGSITGAITQAVANMAIALGHPKTNISTNSTIKETKQAEENIFNIYADFPNANDVNDIREAILSLPNLASQYVARNYK